MIKINMQEGKTNFSSYLDPVEKTQSRIHSRECTVEKGEVMVVCRHNQPIAEFRAITSPHAGPTRVPGLLKGFVDWQHAAFAPLTSEETEEELAAVNTSALFPQ